MKAEIHTIPMAKIKIIFFIVFSFSTSITHAEDWSKAQIEFWKKIYTQTTSSEWVIHDAINLKYVYRVVSEQPEKAKKEVIETLNSIYQKNKWRKSVNVEALTDSEQLIYELRDANEDPRSYLFAADMGRVRSQQGLKDKQDEAVVISRQYLPRMEEMFIEEGVPKEITRLPFVESGFLNEARSSVGATGIWQFMPRTALKNLRVDTGPQAAIDERYDPLKSTRAAARFLKENYKILKSWNLAVMAYHHGAGLVLKAVKQLKTHDAFQIIQYFKDPNFKFASRNYLFEWLAMLEVESKQPLEKLPEYITVSFSKKRFMKDILSQFHLKDRDIRLLNPHFLPNLWSNKVPIPAHYPVRLSGITLEEFRKLE